MITAVNDFLDDLRGGKMSDTPIVRVEQGQLQGKTVSSPSGKSFYSFQGIPYAKPPLGSLRFKAPQPSEQWEDIRDATSEGNVSAQIDRLVHKNLYIGDENCLFLNVYTPNLDGEFLPVMVYIHGGGYRYGSGNSSLYSADYLVEKDVVVVTINYRCGPLGFLSLNTPEVPGNAGLKDVIQAIRWVKDNIGNFGGNSGNVTVFGTSAGGATVSLLTASPLSKDLISKGIIQSGTGLNSWAFQKDPLANAKSLAQLLGCVSEEIDEILDHLSATSAKDIVEAYEKMQPTEEFYEKGKALFGPVVEKEFPGVEAFLTESFVDLLTSGRVAQIPIMIGSTTLEFTHERTADDLQTFIPSDLNVQRNSEEAIAIADQIKTLYFKDGQANSCQNLKEYFELLSDKLVNIDTHRYILYLIQSSNKPLYFYKFDYVGELNLSKKLLTSLGIQHAAHLDELGYLFKNIYQEDVEPTSQDIKMRERMLRLWTNFAKSGNPTPEENHYLTVTWLPVTKDNLYYLNLSNELSLNTNPDKQKMEFWMDLYNKHFKIWEQPGTNTVEVPINDKSDVKVFENLVVIEKEVTVNEEEKTVEIDNVKVIENVTVGDEIIALEKENGDVPVIDNVTVIEETAILKDQPVVISTTIVETVVEKVEKNVEVTEENNFEISNDVSKVEVENNVELKGSSVTEELNDEEPKADEVKKIVKEFNDVKPQNGFHMNGNGVDKKAKTSNEIKMVQNANGGPKDVIRANDPPEDDLPKNIGVNKFVNFFESLGGKK